MSEQDFNPPTSLASYPVPALPSPVDLAGEYRALTVYDRVPDEWSKIHSVDDDRFAPHLKRGEWALVDPFDREPISGELYIVKINDTFAPCGFTRQLVQLRQRAPDERYTPGGGWMLHFSIIRHYGRRLTTDEIFQKLRTGEMAMCDGPLNERGIREKILGRVVGVILGEREDGQ